MLGRRVAVYGGGNTAMDAARTARRLGSAAAVVVYRRTRDRMPAHDIEVTEALDEGVTMRWLSTIKHADEGKLLIEKMRLDETGFPQPTGEFEELEADCLVLALGQNADLSVLEDVPGVTFPDRHPARVRTRRNSATPWLASEPRKLRAEVAQFGWMRRPLIRVGVMRTYTSRAPAAHG
jgi:NADPH-dependent glutamate synthase beta subunit-like oxidoreductase